jgi:hypothetical protein
MATKKSKATAAGSVQPQPAVIVGEISGSVLARARAEYERREAEPQGPLYATVEAIQAEAADCLSRLANKEDRQNKTRRFIMLAAYGSRLTFCQRSIWGLKKAGPVLPERPGSIDELQAAFSAVLRWCDETKRPAATGTPWTKSDTPTRWGKAFGFSADTFIRRCEDGLIRHKRLSDRSYQVHSDDLPAAPESRHK